MYKGKIYLRDFFKTFKKVWGFQYEGFPYSGIWMFTGGQGSGKTLNAVQCVLDIKKEFPFCRIISNIPLDIEGVEEYKGLVSFEENNGIDGIVYFLDEIQVLYSSMQSKGVTDSSLYIWSQNRKNRRVIIGTSQRFSRVAKPIREQVRWVHDMHKVAFNFYSYRMYDGYEFDDDGNYLGEKPPLSFAMPSIQAYEAYDTRQIVIRKDRLI